MSIPTNKKESYCSACGTSNYLIHSTCKKCKRILLINNDYFTEISPTLKIQKKLAIKYLLKKYFILISLFTISILLMSKYLTNFSNRRSSKNTAKILETVTIKDWFYEGRV